MAVKCKDCGERYDRDEIAYDGDIEKTRGKHARCLDCHEEYIYKQKQDLAMDKQTAEHLYNTGQYEEVCVHIGSMYGLTREQSLVKPAHYTWKDQADACMKAVGI